MLLITVLAAGAVGFAVGTLWADRWIERVLSEIDWGVEDDGAYADTKG